MWGGICHVIHIYVKPNNKYIKNYLQMVLNGSDINLNLIKIS